MAKDKKPWFKFYPGDWRKDENLNRCSHEAKGVFVDLMCVMFECSERGVLATDGEAWTDQEIARLLGGDQQRTLACLHELAGKRVIRRNDSGAYYSLRMVRDEQKRKQNVRNGSLGGKSTQDKRRKDAATAFLNNSGG